MSDSVSVGLTSASGIAIRPLDPALDTVAAEILGAATEEGTTEAAARLIAASRANDGSGVFGLTANGRLLAVYITRRIPLSLELAAIAVSADARRQGYGRACLVDALRLAGRLPLVVESPEDAVGFFKSCGFKVVRRRVTPDGKPRFKLGWHAPRPGGEPNPLGGGTRQAGQG